MNNKVNELVEMLIDKDILDGQIMDYRDLKVLFDEMGEKGLVSHVDIEKINNIMK